MAIKKINKINNNSKINCVGFFKLFTQDERITIRSAAKTDPVIEDFMNILSMMEQITINDKDIVDGMKYLVDQGHITVDREEKIMNTVRKKTGY